MKATVIISDVDGQGALVPCVLALCNQDVDGYEVILPDLGLRKEERFLLESIRKQYSLFSVLKKKGNRARLLNEAARRAKGGVLVFVESHCLPGRGWLRRLLRAVKNEHVVLGRTRVVESGYWTAQAEAWLRKKVDREMRRLGTDVSYLDAHNVAIRKKVFWEMGGLWEEIPIMAEFELGARLHEAGVRIARADVEVLHVNDRTLRGYARVIAEQGRDKARMFLYHGDKFMQTYFPAPRFRRLVPFLGVVRLPLLAITRGLVLAGMFGFTLAKLARWKGLAFACFSVMARNAFRSGLFRQKA